MTLNIELLRDAVAWAEAEAEKGKLGDWNQNVWAEGQVGERRIRDEDGDLHRVIKISCGTSFCIAGNICASKGDRFLASPYKRPGDEAVAEYVMLKGSREVRYIRSRAIGLLGVDDDETLFDSDNSIEDVRRIAELIAAKHGYEL